MIPAFSDPQGRDSYGRGLDDTSVRAAVRADSRVIRERDEQRAYLEAAYRDPSGAKERLDELVARDGVASAARRIAAEPSSLGELQGRTRFLAGAAARAERARAETVAGALADNVRRVGEAEAFAEQAYRGQVEAQRRADAVSIPVLSERAQAALQAIVSAHSRTAQAEAHQALRADHEMRKEVRAFAVAMAQRFGEDGVRAITRAEGQAGAFRAKSVGAEHRKALDRAARALYASKLGERMSEAREAERADARESLRQGRGFKL